MNVDAYGQVLLTHVPSQIIAVHTFESETIQENSVLVKMLRVMLLAPFLIIISFYLLDKKSKKRNTGRI